jgi:hypothetical protein
MRKKEGRKEERRNREEARGRSNSAANQDHGAIGHVGNVEHARMLLLLALHSGTNHIQELLLLHTGSKGVPQTNLGVPKQADLSVGWVGEGM